MSGFRFVFVVLSFTGILILAVYLRRANNQIFYRISLEAAAQERLSEEIGDKQLRVESLINPTAVSESIEQ